MKITSWNVNGIRASMDKGLSDFVKKEKPDILCLQETKAHVDQLDKRFRFPSSYPCTYWSSSGMKKGYSGTATFSKKPCKTYSTSMGIKKFDWEGRMVITEYKTFTLLNIYFPNGAMTEERHNFKQEFLDRITLFLLDLKKQGRSLIIVGDYNTAYLDEDVYSPKMLGKTSGFLPEEREWMRAFIDKGFIDVFRHFYPSEKEAFTWWSYREKARQTNRGWRIDHICVTEDLLKVIKDIRIHKDQLGSDHCPISLITSKKLL